MSVHSKTRAKAIRIHQGAVLAFAALLVALLAFWPASRAAASTTAPFAGELTRSATELGAVAPEARAIVGFRIHRTLRAFRPAPKVMARAVYRPFISTRLVLTPRKLAANAGPGAVAANLTEDVPVAPALMVKATWADAADPTLQDNPFTLVGNRSGLVNATQTEVRGGEVWLTAGGAKREPVNAGVAQGGTP